MILNWTGHQGRTHSGKIGEAVLLVVYFSIILINYMYADTVRPALSVEFLILQHEQYYQVARIRHTVIS